MDSKSAKCPLQYRLLRWIIFKIGDIRWIGWKSFPFILTWDVHSHKIDLNEVDYAKSLLQVGDIILHRDEGYASNLGIPGIMIHAGIVTSDIQGRPTQIIEAVSEGVVKRNVGHILYSDYACIMRPKLENAPKVLALLRAEKIIGCEYDVEFNFNTEEELQIINNDKEYKQKVRFCCTEIPHFCYLEYMERLGVFRKKNINLGTRILSWLGLSPGEAIVTADMYVEAHGFKMIWRSKGYTVDWAKDVMNASEAHLFKLKTKV